jgi:hypothetical protein
MIQVRRVVLACGCSQAFSQRRDLTIKLGVRVPCPTLHPGHAYRSAFAEALKRAGVRLPQRGSARP